MTCEDAKKIINENLRQGNLVLALDVARSSMEELQKYQAIGTVDELEDLKDLQTPRTAQKVLGLRGIGHECPNCGNELDVNAINGMYCHWCGQKLRREEENE